MAIVGSLRLSVVTVKYKKKQLIGTKQLANKNLRDDMNLS